MHRNMKFVALLSGGKDSCYNIMKCIEYGHELVALANLYPSDEEADEINSFMYQSAGHSVIPMFAECFQVPLYRKKIAGLSHLCLPGFSTVLCFFFDLVLLLFLCEYTYEKCNDLACELQLYVYI